MVRDAEPNPGHRLLARLLARGLTIITPNYDTLIEQCIPSVAFAGGERAESIDATVGDAGVRRAWKEDVAPVPGQGYLLKVHGTVEEPASLVFELAQESRLAEWEATRIKNFISGQVLVCLGYSGWDFDILPELMESRPICTHWLAQRDEDIPEDARRLIVSTDGTVWRGDLRLLLEEGGAVVDPVDTQELARQSVKLLRRFDREQKRLWCGVSLVRLGMGADGLAVLRRCRNVPDCRQARWHRELGWGYYHVGRYLDAVREFSKARGRFTSI